MECDRLPLRLHGLQAACSRVGGGSLIMLSNILTIGLLSVGLSADAHAKGDVENGKKVYAQRCEQCHGADGDADGAEVGDEDGK
mgnify:CR=1 FL=1